MSEFQDHLDIEKLPLEIDGIPVRETIREIFRDPKNGTPDNISKAGCLALAWKSNEVGEEEGRGYVVWNAWRSNFPLMVNFAFTGFRNNVDFSSFSYPNPDEKKLRLNFSNFEFGVEANFRGSCWGDDANFRGAKWGGRADFRGAVWGERADFRGARWGVLTVSKAPIHHILMDWRSYTDFQGAKDGYLSDFGGARWGGEAQFQGAQWVHGANFEGAQWGALASFQGAQWAGKTNFDSTEWGDGAVFSAATWDDIRGVYLDPLAFDSAKDWALTNGMYPDAFGDISFDKAQFQGPVVFNNRRFRGNASFSFGIFKRVPQFHGCEFHQTPNFWLTEFPPATGSEEVVSAYRSLKLAFGKQQAFREEHRFFRLEMGEEAQLRKGLESVLIKSYKWSSNYGVSVLRPSFILIFSWLFFAQIYGAYAGNHALCLLCQPGCSLQGDWLSFSLQQALPLPGIDKWEHSIKSVPVAWLIFHKTISLAALFLIGLALRNLFKLK